MIDIRYCKHCEKEIFFDELTNKWIHRDNGFPQCYFEVAEPKPLRCDKTFTFIEINEPSNRYIAQCERELEHAGRHEAFYYGKRLAWEYS